MSRQDQGMNMNGVPSSNLRRQIAEGLLFSHSALNRTSKEVLEATSFLYALIELLEESELITLDELDQRKRVVADRLVRKFNDS